MSSAIDNIVIRRLGWLAGSDHARGVQLGDARDVVGGCCTKSRPRQWRESACWNINVCVWRFRSA